MRRRLLIVVAALAMALGLVSAPSASATAAWSIKPACGHSYTEWGAYEGTLITADVIWVHEYVTVCYNAAGYITAVAMDADMGTNGAGYVAGYGGHNAIAPYGIYHIDTGGTGASGHIYGTAQACLASWTPICAYSEDFWLTFRAISPAINGGHVDVNGNVTQVHWLIIDTFAGCRDTAFAKAHCFLHFHKTG